MSNGDQAQQGGQINLSCSVTQSAQTIAAAATVPSIRKTTHTVTGLYLVDADVRKRPTATKGIEDVIIASASPLGV
tara:strand:+ start:254 stop:481 length:228 start_codon:yes stop_codon:yes gene_type:complete